MYFKSAGSKETSLVRPQLFACNRIHVHNLAQVEGLINLPHTMLCYNIWIAPSKLVGRIQARVQAAANCLANVVVEQDKSSRADDWLSAILKELLRVGSPNEHLLQECCEHEGLPDGAAKHLLGVKQDGTRNEFAALLREFADVAPA